jgi:endo-1,3(4)-beta-glucanase
VLMLFQVIFISAAPFYRRKLCSSNITVKDLVTVAIPPATAARNGQSFGQISISAVLPRVTVLTTSVSLGTAQILPALGTQNPGTVGVILVTLQTSGLPTGGPILSASIGIPTSLIQTTDSPITITTLAENTAMPSSDIFQAVDTDAPPSIIGTRSDHPVARLGIQPQNSPLSTNKFYANFFLGSQTAPTWTHPYSLAWAKGGGSARSWGMSVSHIDANQRVFGPNPAANPASYFINPNGIQSLVLSAAELGSSTIISTDSLTASSINVNLIPSAGAAPAITFPLVQGMGFVTGLYNGATPVVQTGVFFRNISRSALSPKAGVTKYTFVLEDGKTWLLYAYSPSGLPLSLTVVSNSLAQSTSNWYGIIQLAKNPGGAAEALYDAACGAYATSAALSGSVNGTTGTYSISFTKAGLTKTTLLMFALPHHIQSFSSVTQSCSSSIQLQTTTKGIATAVVADSWILVEPDMPLRMHFAPWSPTSGNKSTLSASVIATIQSAAVNELSQDMNQQTNLNSFYYAGKVVKIIPKKRYYANVNMQALAKFAGIVYVVNDIVKNPSLAQAGLAKLKAAFELFSSNKNQFPLVYECE